jgi:hypothetical protein
VCITRNLMVKKVEKELTVIIINIYKKTKIVKLYFNLFTGYLIDPRTSGYCAKDAR